jgi:hypothetical protein
MPKIVFVNLAVLIGLYLLTEAILHAVSSCSNPLLAKPPLNMRDPASPPFTTVRAASRF